MHNLKYFPWVREYLSNGGTGTLLNFGGAVPGFATFLAAGYINNHKVFYTIESGLDKEYGWGYYKSTNQIARSGIITHTLVGGVMTVGDGITTLGRINVVAGSSIISVVAGHPTLQWAEDVREANPITEDGRSRILIRNNVTGQTSIQVADGGTF